MRRTGDGARRPDRLAALRHPRDQADFRAEQHPRQPAGENAIGHVQGAVARRRQAAEEIAGGSARAQLVQQVLDIRRAALGMDQRGMGREVGGGGGGRRRQWLLPGEQPERAGRQCRRHQHHGRLVEVFDAAGADAHASRTHPGHARPGFLQRGEDGLCGRRVIVAQVAPAERKRGRSARLCLTRRNLRVKLLPALGQGCMPVAMGCVSVHKSSSVRHGRSAFRAMMLLDSRRQGVFRPAGGRIRIGPLPCKHPASCREARLVKTLRKSSLQGPEVEA